MYRKVLLGAILTIAIIFSFTSCFANNMINEAGNMMQDAGDNIRNAMNNAGNAVEDAARNISGASQDATENITQKANNIGNELMNTDNNNQNDNAEYNADFNNNAGANYNTTRVATTDTTGNATFMGMDANMWTWLIVGVAAIAIIALIWYYTMQLRSSDNHRD